MAMLYIILFLALCYGINYLSSRTKIDESLPADVLLTSEQNAHAGSQQEGEIIL